MFVVWPKESTHLKTNLNATLAKIGRLFAPANLVPLMAAVNSKFEKSKQNDDPFQSKLDDRSSVTRLGYFSPIGRLLKAALLFISRWNADRSTPNIPFGLFFTTYGRLLTRLGDFHQALGVLSGHTDRKKTVFETEIRDLSPRLSM